MPEEDAVPGAVIAIQSFGDFLGFNPHLHILCTDGCFYGNGMFKEEYRRNWARLIQKIHPVEFPEGNPIQRLPSTLIGETAMGVNGGLYPDLARKDATPNKFHRCKDIPPYP